MTREGRGPGGKLGPPPCAHGRWEGADGGRASEPGGQGPADDAPVGDPTPSDAPPMADPAPEPDDPAADDEVFFCDLCGAEMINRHCKLACPACGYQRDCSDP